MVVVVVEKQNLPVDHTSARHRIRRLMMWGALMGPRLMNRPRLVEWNPQLRGTADHPDVFHTLLQSRFYQPDFRNAIPRRSSFKVPEHDSIRPYQPRHQTPAVFCQSNRSNLTKRVSDPDVHIIPITHINTKETDRNTKASPSVIEIDITSPPENEDEQSRVILDINKDDEKDDSVAHVIVIPDEVSSCDNSNNSSTTRRCSLPRSPLSRKEESHIKAIKIADEGISVSNDIVIVDEPIIVEEDQSVKKFRLKKNTLVGGANKVHDGADTDGYYTGENMDPAGAAYLSVKNKTLDISASGDIHLSSDEEKPVNDVPNYPVYVILKQKLKKECRQIDHIKGDGNCFFRALSKQLYGSERFHIVLRNLIVDITATNKNCFAQFVDGGDVQDHVERMSQEQSWATTCEIYAAATLLQRDIFMLTPDHLNETYSWLLFKPVFKSDTQQSNIESHPCYITLCNTNGNHYDRIVGEHGGCNCFLPHPELEGVSYTVDLT